MANVLAMVGGFRGFFGRLRGNIPAEFLAPQTKRFQDGIRPVFFFLLDLFGFLSGNFRPAACGGELLLFFGLLSRLQGVAGHFWRQVLDRQSDQFGGGRLFHIGSDLALLSGTADKRNFGRIYSRHRGGFGQRSLEIRRRK